MNKLSSTHEMNKPPRTHRMNEPSSTHQRHLCGSLICASWHIHDGIPTRPPKDSSKAYVHTNTHTHIHTCIQTKHVNIQSNIIMKVLQQQQGHTHIYTYTYTSWKCCLGNKGFLLHYRKVRGEHGKIAMGINASE